MKPAFTRRYRRRKTNATRDGNFFNKETQHDQAFFADAPQSTFFQPAPSAINRKCDKCEEEDKQAHRMTDKKEEDDKHLQRNTDKKEDDDKKLQKKEGGGQPAPVANASGYIKALNAGGQALPKNVNQFFKQRMGYGFHHVKVHTGNEAAKSAKELNAKAYTIGEHIVFNEGQYQPETYEGRKLLAHELTHVLQQQEGRISRKGEEEDCGESLDLEGKTDAVYNKGASKTVGEKKVKAKDCEDCEDDCINVTGSLKVPYTVSTTVNLPTVPGSLRPCQQKIVSTAIKNQLAPHEQQHVKAFKTFEGTPSLSINYKGCEGGYQSYLEDLAQTEYDKRKTAADDKSAKLDPFMITVDLCCKDKEQKPGKK
jgi:hypothetical protein